MDETEPDESDVFSQEFWDQRYAGSERVWSGRPNQRLVELAAGLTPGTALDVGCGEGADVVWLAQQGWRVTGADISVVALERAEAHAAEAGVADRTSWVHADLVAGAALPGDQDLVTAMFVHVPEAEFDRVYTAIGAAVRPGGGRPGGAPPRLAAVVSARTRRPPKVAIARYALGAVITGRRRASRSEEVLERRGGGDALLELLDPQLDRLHVLARRLLELLALRLGELNADELLVVLAILLHGSLRSGKRVSTPNA